MHLRQFFNINTRNSAVRKKYLSELPKWQRLFSAFFENVVQIKEFLQVFSWKFRLLQKRTFQKRCKSDMACAFPVKRAKCFLRLFIHTLEQFGKTFSYVLLKMIGAFTKSQTFSITTVNFAIHTWIVFFLLLKLFEALNRNVWLIQALIIWNDIRDGRIFNGGCFCQTLIKF